MTGSAILQMQFDRLMAEFNHTLENLSQPKLAWRSAPGMNDIGSLVWHSARAWDGYLFYCDGAEELFVSQDWAKRFGMTRKPSKSWVNVFTEDQLAFVRAKPKLFLEYVDSIHARTTDFLSTASPEQLSAPVQIRWWTERRPRAFVLAHILRHSYEHLGEAHYVQGLMKAKTSQHKANKTRPKAKRKLKIGT